MTRMFMMGRKLLTKKALQPFITSPVYLPKLPTLIAAEIGTCASDTKASKTVPFIRPLKIHDAKFFASLKKEESQQFPHKKRDRSSYKDNCSAALALPYSNQLLATKRNDQAALLALSKEYIIEHANRRVDLFFYTLIAYYKTEFIPTHTQTTLQHGRGRCTRRHTILTEACHSSFTPSLLDDSILQERQTGAKHKSLLTGTHFMDSLNATVELPSFVNDLDDVLENTCRPKCIEFLRDVSLGKLGPIEGLTHFLKMMSTLLKNLQENAQCKSHSAVSSHFFAKQPSLNSNLIELVLTGTLSTTFSAETQTATDDYIQLLLRLTPKEKILCENKEDKEKLYLKKIMEIQNEILQTKSYQPSL